MKNAMRKSLVVALLLVASSSESAEWVKVGSSAIFTAYADIAAIRRQGELVKMWHVYDFKTSQRTDAGKAFMSIMAQEEYDCKEERWRTLHESYHSGNMRSGETIDTVSSGLGRWEPIPPDSVGKALWILACSKR